MHIPKPILPCNESQKEPNAFFPKVTTYALSGFPREERIVSDNGNKFMMWKLLPSIKRSPIKSTFSPTWLNMCLYDLAMQSAFHDVEMPILVSVMRGEPLLLKSFNCSKRVFFKTSWSCACSSPLACFIPFNGESSS